MSGVLYLPSLKEKKFIEVKNLDLDEALVLIDDFTAKVASNRKTKDTGDAIGSAVVYVNSFVFNGSDIGFDDEDSEEIIHALKLADTRGIRGARAVFIDQSDGTFAVGTAVVYNANWATLNFEDNTITDKLRYLCDHVLSVALSQDVAEEEEETKVEDGPNGTWWHPSSC